MADIHIISSYAENINCFYTGKDYWQPAGVALIRLSNEKLVTVEYADFNLGVFGKREDFTVMTNGFQWSWSESYTNEEWGTPQDHLDAIFRSIENVLDVDPVELLAKATNAIGITARYNWAAKTSI